MVMPKMVVVGVVFISGAPNPLRKFAVNSFILFLNGVCRFFCPKIDGYDGIASTRNLRVTFSYMDD
jgi:hypothetical protein